MEALNKLLLRVRELELFKCLNVDMDYHMEEVAHLFFMDDNLVFYEPEERAILNLRCVLLSFQVVSELNINLIKSKLVRLYDGRDDLK